MIGMDILRGVMLAYPKQLEVHHFFSDVATNKHLLQPPSSSGKVIGQIHPERLKSYHLTEIVSKKWDGTNRYGQVAIVCGSDSLTSTVVDSLLDIGISTSDMKILASQNWLDQY